MSLSDLGRYAGKAGKKAAEMGRFFASEWLREPGAQQMLMKKAEPFLTASLKSGIDQLSTAIRQKRNYKTNRKDLDGGGLIDPFDLIYGPDQITHRGRVGRELMCIKLLENFQNQKKDGHFPGITTLGLTTHWMNSYVMIPQLGKSWNSFRNQLGKLMLLRRSMMLIIQSAKREKIHANAKIKQTGKWLPLWMRFPGKKDSGVMLWHET